MASGVKRVHERLEVVGINVRWIEPGRLTHHLEGGNSLILLPLVPLLERDAVMTAHIQNQIIAGAAQTQIFIANPTTKRQGASASLPAANHIASVAAVERNDIVATAEVQVVPALAAHQHRAA